MLRVTLALILILTAAVVCQAQEAERRCDFSAYKPLFIDHAPLSATKKVEPEYPKIAKAGRAEGDVQVMIAVNRKGDVVKACASDGHPLLRGAAEQAALGWKFKWDDGFFRRNKKLRYIGTWIVIRFRLE